MKWLIFFSLLLGLQANASGSVDPLGVINEAWQYVSVKGKTDRWIILSSKKTKSEYFQCENLDDVVSCVVPVWTKIATRGRIYAPVDPIDSPHPEIEGSVFEELHDSKKVELAQAVFKQYNLSYFFMYHKLENEHGKIVGTSCDLIVMLPLNYTQFESLTKSYLNQVFGVTEDVGYELEKSDRAE